MTDRRALFLPRYSKEYTPQEWVSLVPRNEIKSGDIEGEDTNISVRDIFPLFFSQVEVSRGRPHGRCYLQGRILAAGGTANTFSVHRQGPMKDRFWKKKEKIVD